MSKNRETFIRLFLSNLPQDFAFKLGVLAKYGTPEARGLLHARRMGKDQGKGRIATRTKTYKFPPTFWVASIVEATGEEKDPITLLSFVPDRLFRLYEYGWSSWPPCDEGHFWQATAPSGLAHGIFLNQRAHHRQIVMKSDAPRIESGDELLISVTPHWQIAEAAGDPKDDKMSGAYVVVEGDNGPEWVKRPHLFALSAVIGEPI